ncbi:hypothetical protein Tco_0680722 [Tanacetum coccineum]|uniref:Uncharacterized protein n=1 Tax=Tanacetum coccineum TaxID=301880 RepID=A0ABQ4XMG7_9ASTR
MESNKSIDRSNEQKNLYKALVEAYKSDKLILDTYGDIVSFKRHSDDEDKDKEPSAGSNRGKDLEEPAHQEFDIGATEEQSDEETSQHPDWWQYPHDLRKPLPLIPNSRGSQVIPFDHFINNDLAYLSGGVSSRTYATSVTKTKAADYGHIKWIEDLVPNTIWSEVPEGDFKRIRLQDIKGVLILLVQDKLTNLNVEDHLAFGVSLRMFTKSIVIQRRVEDLQLVVKSYQKKLNITKPDTYRSDLKRRDAYTTYSNPKGFIYQNKDKKNKLMRIDELYKSKIFNGF